MRRKVYELCTGIMTHDVKFLSCTGQEYYIRYRHLKFAKMREKIAYSLPGRCQVAYEAGEETQALDKAVKLISAASFLADIVKARKLFARSKSWYDKALKFRVR